MGRTDESSLAGVVDHGGAGMRRRTPKEEQLYEQAAFLVEDWGGRFERLPPSTGEKHRLDYLAVHPRKRPIYLELKRVNKWPTPEQVETMERLHAQGFATGWAWHTDQVEACLRAWWGRKPSGRQRVNKNARTARERGGPIVGGVDTAMGPLSAAVRRVL